MIGNCEGSLQIASVLLVKQKIFSQDEDEEGALEFDEAGKKNMKESCS